MPIKKGQRVKSAAAFRFVPAAKVDDQIFQTVGRKSVYADALHHLVEHPEERMEVDSPGARTGIASQANKNGIKILFGEANGKLYVKVIGKESPEQTILDSLEDQPMNLVEIESLLAKKHRGLRAQDVLDTLARNGKIALQTVTGTNAKKWHLLRGPRAVSA